MWKSEQNSKRKNFSLHHLNSIFTIHAPSRPPLSFIQSTINHKGKKQCHIEVMGVNHQQVCVALYFNKSLGFFLGLVLIMKEKKNANVSANLDQPWSWSCADLVSFHLHMYIHCTCGRSSSAFWLHRSDFFYHFYFFSPSASPSLCPSLRCCLASGHLGQIIILKLKWAVWTQNWGMNCLIELAAVAAFPAARTELFALSSSHPHLGA